MMGSKKDDWDILGWLLLLAVIAVLGAIFLQDVLMKLGGW